MHLQNVEKRKKMKRIVNILVVFLILTSLFTMMVGCQLNETLASIFGNSGSEEGEPVYSDYTVTVRDSLGTPMPNVMVNFTNSEGVTKTRVTDKNGTAVFRNALETNYKVTFEKGLSDAVISGEEYTLTKEIKTLDVVLRDETKSVDIYGEVPEGTYATQIGVGNYNLACEASQPLYFVFYAYIEGVYKISISSNDDNMVVAYLGSPMFVQSVHVGEGEYDGKSFQLTVNDSLAPHVLGVCTSTNTDLTLTIERIGEVPFDPHLAPWKDISATGATFDKCDTTGKTLVDVDISDSEFSAVLGDDGLYYSADGKLIYIRITSTSPYGRLDESMQFVPALSGSLALLAGHVDEDVGINIGGYVYDEEGNFLDKYRYNDMIKTYMDLADSKYGVVPMTEELAECIKLHGESNGWWNSENPGYIFEGIDVDADNAWLFLCMIEN